MFAKRFKGEKKKGEWLQVVMKYLLHVSASLPFYLLSGKNRKYVVDHHLPLWVFMIYSVLTGYWQY